MIWESLWFDHFFFSKKTSTNIQVSFPWLPVLKYANSIKARDDLQSSQSVFSIISRCQFNLLLLLPFYIIKRMSMKTCYLNDCFLSADIKQQSWENRVTEHVLGNNLILKWHYKQLQLRNECLQTGLFSLHTLHFKTVSKLITYLVAFLVIQVSNAAFKVKRYY